MDPTRNDIRSVFVKLASFWRKRLTWVPRPDTSHPHLTPSDTLWPTSDSSPGCVVSGQHPASAALGAYLLHQAALRDPAQHRHPQRARTGGQCHLPSPSPGSPEVHSDGSSRDVSEIKQSASFSQLWPTQDHSSRWVPPARFTLQSPPLFTGVLLHE